MSALALSAPAAAADQFGPDEIFFGSVPVHLQPVPGRVVPYAPGAFGPDPARDAAGRPARTLARKDPLPHPDGGPPVVVPCMPCLDTVRTAATADDRGDGDALADWPAALRQPLLKVPAPVAGAPKAFASGCRSACAKIDGAWYRLKGSGNNDQGFLVKTSSTVLAAGEPLVATRQIRGAAFEHTPPSRLQSKRC